MAVPVPSTYSYQTGRRVVEQDYQFGFKDDAFPDDEAKESSVKIVTPNTGRSYYFHRLLVLGTKISLTANVKEPPQPKAEPLSWWSTLFQRVKSVV